MDHTVVEQLESQIRQFRYPNPMDIRNLLNYPAEREMAFIPDIDDVVKNKQDEADEADDESLEHPKIIPADAHRMLYKLEILRLQQVEDFQEIHPYATEHEGQGQQNSCQPNGSERYSPVL